MISRYKLKIIAWFTGFSLIVMSFIFLITYFIIWAELNKEVDEAIHSTINSIGPLAGQTPIKNIPKELEFFYEDRLGTLVNIFNHNYNNKIVAVMFKNDTLIYNTPGYQDIVPFIKNRNIKPLEISEFGINSIPFKATLLRDGSTEIYIAYDISYMYSISEHLHRALIFILPLGFILSLSCGYFATHRSLKLINGITSLAARISSKNLNERIDQPSGNDEFSQLIKTFNSMIDRLEKSFTITKQFSEDAAHEIRTPLTVMRCELENLIKEKDFPEKYTEIHEGIINEIRTLSSTANKLLLIHSLDTVETKYPISKVDLSKLFTEIAEDVKILTDKSNIIFTTDFANETIIQGNEELLSRLIWNLTDNAVKYTNPKGKVHLSLQQNNSNTIIIVTDTGIGISESELPKIFERFYRVEKSRSRQHGGSGLGLSICKWIADFHNADIKVESKLGEGSTFTLIFKS